MSKEVTNRKDILKALIGAAVFLIILDLTPLGGNMWFYARWVQCDQKPVYGQRHSGLAKPTVPNYDNYVSNFSFVRGYGPYFCSPKDAEKAGYSADAKTYSFPHLSDDEAKDAYFKAQKL